MLASTKGLMTIQPGVARGAIHQIDGALAVADRGVLITARKIESQSGHRFPGGFDFGAFHGAH